MAKQRLFPVPPRRVVHDVDDQPDRVDDGADADGHAEEQDDLLEAAQGDDVVEGPSRRSCEMRVRDGHEDVLVCEERAVEESRDHRGEARRRMKTVPKFFFR